MTEPAHSLPAKRSEPKSIQGEQQEAAQTDVYTADQADVEEWVDTHSPNVVSCRERNRHDYPTVSEEVAKEGTLHFIGVDAETGLHIRHVVGESCQLVGRFELWDIRHKGDRVTSTERVSAKPDYSLRGPNGERYLLKPGHGRMQPKQVRNAVATGALKGVSFTALRKAAMRGGKKS